MTQPGPSYLPLLRPPAEFDGPALWFAFREGEIAVIQGVDGMPLPVCTELTEIGLVADTQHYLGLYGEQHCYAVELALDAPLPANLKLQGLRSLFGKLDEGLAVLAGRAFQIKDWDRNHRFCGRCGTPTVQRGDERARVCAACRRTSYPPVTPAIMVLVLRGRELLLARRVGADATRYAALAGFVEPGEQLEDTAHREVREEVGIEIDDLRYFGSQPWPFPHSLMVAFTAQYAGGDLRPDGVEIGEAKWFSAADVLKRPYTPSIGWRLINTVAGRLARGEEV
jgi:NAD+ diphosphatase